jgi:hypothetical protein
MICNNFSAVIWIKTIQSSFQKYFSRSKINYSVICNNNDEDSNIFFYIYYNCVIDFRSVSSEHMDILKYFHENFALKNLANEKKNR